MRSTELDGCVESGTAWTVFIAAHCAVNAASEDAYPEPNCLGAEPALYLF
jgi:hypothetical protein